jgi:predicted NBD/HSP70 family sugar kinase
MGEYPLTVLLEERLGCSVFIDNDSRAMAYGEYMCGAGQGTRNMLFINASWGLGMGMVLDGKLFYGKSGFSGELGHFPFFDNEVLCRCGKRGCLETGASGIATHRLFTEKLAEGRISSLSCKFSQKEDISLEDIVEAVGREDVLAIEVMEQIGSDLGRAISGLINMFNPELIVVGGTLAATGDYLLLPIKGAINKYSLTLVSRETDVRLSKLGEVAGVIGACTLVRSKTLNLL